MNDEWKKLIENCRLLYGQVFAEHIQYLVENNQKQEALNTIEANT